MVRPLTFEAFRLLGNANLLTWPYDQPEALHRLMAFLREDRVAWFDFLEREGLLGLNNNWTFVGSGSPGFTTALPAADYAGKARLKDLWVGVESQETTSISPDQFAEFFLPYMADVCRPFGLAYYGCCEPVHDRWHHIIKAIPQVRGVVGVAVVRHAEGSGDAGEGCGVLAQAGAWGDEWSGRGLGGAGEGRR